MSQVIIENPIINSVISREKAQIWSLPIPGTPPTSPMRREAASAGFYESPWGKHPRISATHD